MSQESILKLLKKNPQGLTAKEIKDKLEIGMPTIWRSLMSMRNYGELKIIEEETTAVHGKRIQMRYFPL